MWLDWLVFCDCGFSLSALWWRRIRGLWWDRLTERETGSCSDGRGHAQQILNPIFCWWVELCSLSAIYLGPNYGGGNEDNGSLLQKIPWMYCYCHCPQPCSRPLLTMSLLETPRHSWASLGHSLCGVTAPVSWVRVHISFYWYPPRVYFPVLCKFWQIYGGVNGDLLQEALCHTQVCCT